MTTLGAIGAAIPAWRPRSATLGASVPHAVASSPSRSRSRCQIGPRAKITSRGVGDGAAAGLREAEELLRPRALEAFVDGGGITEENMERLVEVTLSGGQSGEDYRRRALMQSKISEFFSQRRAYVVEEADSRAMEGVVDDSRGMQGVVDAALACDGRSATDYNCRAQLFTKSAETFPYAASRS